MVSGKLFSGRVMAPECNGRPRLFEPGGISAEGFDPPITQHPDHDNKLAHERSESGAVIQTHDLLLSTWNEAISERRLKYPEQVRLSHGQRSIIEEVEDDGVCLVKDFFPVATVDRLASEFSKKFERLIDLKAPKKFVPGKQFFETPRLSLSDLENGETSARTLTNVIQIDEPAMVCPKILELALHQELLDTIGGILAECIEVTVTCVTTGSS